MIDYNGSAAAREDVIACTSMILGTVRESMPYMRDMGISAGVLGGNTPEAADAYVSDATEQVEEWDERVRVEEIVVKQDTDGKIQARVVLEDGE